MSLMLETILKKISYETNHQFGNIKKNTELFVVANGSVEYTNIVSKFMLTMTNATILTVQQIQNQFLWEKFIHHKSMIELKNGLEANEMELFLGTSDTFPELIYDSEEGFDMRFSQCGMWGYANYFAVDTKYSDSYAHWLPNGHRQMFVANVLTGSTCMRTPNSSLRMPPLKTMEASSDIDFKDVRHDYVSGVIGDNIVYMTYDNLKAYPAYLITYCV